MAVASDFNVAMQRIAASGGVVGTNLDFSNIEVRVNDGSNMFAKGDKFSMPTLEELPKVKFQRKFRGNNAYGVLVNVGGVTKELYVSTFIKSVVPYNDDSTRVKDASGNFVPAVVAKGTAVEEWKKHANVEDALKALAGKEVEIKEVELVQTMRQRTNGVRNLGNQWVFTIDLVA